MRNRVDAPLIWVAFALTLSHPFNLQSQTHANPFPAGANVEVMSSGVWYPAKVKEVRARGRWFISYDGYGSSWDEEVGPDRIRARGVGAPVNAGTGNNIGTQAAQTAAFKVGDAVEVNSYGSWYPAKVKELRGRDRWFISYDGYGSNWDEEVGRDRIRAKGSAATSGTTTGNAANKADETFAWPARPARTGTAIEGAYFELVMFVSRYTTYTYISWFFTKNGRFAQSPRGGVSLEALATKARPGKNEGAYWVEGNQLVLAWADGRQPWRRSGYKSPQVLPIGAGATRQSGFPRGWRFDGSYEGGASVGGGAVSSSNTLNFRRDGTYTRGSVVNVSSTGRTTEVSGGATGGATGTYQFDEYTLTLRENGTEKKYTVFAFGDRDAAGRPEQIFWEGGMVKRQNK